MKALLNNEIIEKLSKIQSEQVVTSHDYSEGYRPCQGCGGGATNCNGNF